MSPFYYKYIDPIVDYLQPLPQIVSDPVVILVVALFVCILCVTAVLFKASHD